MENKSEDNMRHIYIHTARMEETYKRTYEVEARIIIRRKCNTIQKNHRQRRRWWRRRICDFFFMVMHKLYFIDFQLRRLRCGKNVGFMCHFNDRMTEKA
jgi:hypothetical protein